MSSLAFDTHKAIKDLEGAGADEKLAEVVVTTISTAISDQVATKADIMTVQSNIKAVRVKMDAHRVATRAEIKDLRLSTEAEFKAVRVDIKAIQVVLERTATKADMKDLKNTMTIRLGAMIVASIGAVAVFVSALAGLL